MRHLMLLVFLISFSLTGQPTLDSLIQSIGKANDSEKLQIHKSILRMVIHGTEPPDPAYYYRAMDEAIRQQNINYQGIFGMYGALFYKMLGKYDSAVYCGRRSLTDLLHENNLVWASGVSHTLAQTFIDQMLFDSAIYYTLKCLQLHDLQELNPGRYQALETMARIYEEIEDPNQAIIWNRKLYRLSVEHENEEYQQQSLSNIGNVYDLIPNYDSALYYKKRAAALAKKNADENYYMIIGNIGNTFLRTGDLDSAEFYTKMLYDLTRSEHNLPFWSISKEIARSAVNLGAIYYKRGQFGQAEEFLKEGIERSKEIGFKEKLLEAHFWLYNIQKEVGNIRKALDHYEMYVALRDTAQNLEYKNEVSRLAIVYDTDKKEQQLRVLTAEKELKEVEIARTRLIVVGVAVFSLLIIFTIILNNSRQRFKLKAELAEEKERLQKNRFKTVMDAEEKERKRIARELHDGLGQLLSTARITIASLDSEVNPRVENSVKIIDMAVKEVRNISHNMMPNALVNVGLEAALKDIICKVDESGSVSGFYQSSISPNLEESTAISVYRVVQELVNNTLKYAEATEIKLEISGNEEWVSLSLSDNGKGFDTSKTLYSNGIGWNNIYSRVDLLGGKISVRSSPGQGTFVSISIPTKKWISEAG